MRIACCIHKATNTHSEYVIHIAFPLQQCLQEHTAILHHKYIVFIFITHTWYEVFCSLYTRFLWTTDLPKNLPPPFIKPFKNEAQTALFKDPVRTAL